jgi:hypothetical protein
MQPAPFNSCFYRRELKLARSESLGRQAASHRSGEGLGGAFGGGENLIGLIAL